LKILKNDNDPKTNVLYKDVYEYADSINYKGKDRELYVENIIGIKNASYYTYKFCSYGINNGYLQK
jgi:hypothetical protein